MDADAEERTESLPSRRQVARPASTAPSWDHQGKVALRGVLLTAGLSAAAAASTLIPGGTWFLLTVVVAAAGIMALTWHTLIGAPASIFGQIGIAAAALSSGLAVTLSRDLYWAALVTALLVTAVVTLEVLFALKPVDYSDPEARARIKKTASMDAGAAWRTNSTTAAIAASVTGLLIASSGATWVGLVSNARWEYAVILTACVLPVAYGSVRVFRKRWHRLLLLFTCSPVTGGLVAWVLFGLRPLTFAPTFPIPFVDQQSLPHWLIYATLGVAIGLIVAIAVAIVDAIVSSQRRREMPEEAALAALAFLLAAFPVYALIRIG